MGMKKLVLCLVALGLVMAIGLAACGDSETTTTEAVDESTTTTEAVDESTSSTEAESMTEFPQEGENIRWIVPFSPGGGFDTYARTVSRFLPKYLPNQPEVVVENVTGGGSVVGTRELYRSDPDGYTIGLAAYPGIWMAALTQDIGFKPEELTELAILGMDPQALVVAADSPINSVDDLKSQTVKFGSTSRGASMYAFCAIAGEVLGLDYEMITGYGGTSEVVPGIMTGDVDASVLNLGRIVSYIESGDLKAIVTFTDDRSELTPNVPSVKELGYEEATVIASTKAMFVPPDTPANIVSVYRDALNKVYSDEEFIAAAAEGNLLLNLIQGEDMSSRLKASRDAYEEYKPIYAP